MFGGLFSAKKVAGPVTKRPAATKLKRSNIARRFTIISECGVGSMSTVFKALDNATGRVICLKVQDAAKTVAAIGRASNIGRLTEGEIGARIRHPNVVQTFDYGLSNKGEYFLTMEFVEGVSLSAIREARSRDLGGKLNLLRQAAEGLAAIHEMGFIHHDFGPKNVMVSREGVAKIIDFGLAVPNTSQFRKPGNRTGTLGYMAPELLRRESTDERIDLFSFGVMAFELFADRQPYESIQGDQMTVLRLRMNAEPMKLSAAKPDLPVGLLELVEGLVTKRKEDRLKSMEIVTKKLRELEEEFGPEPDR